jgi:hypothetical protein
MSKKKPNRRKSLTPREIKFLQAYQEVQNQAEAAVIAGYSPKNPSQSGAQVMAAIKDKAPDVLTRHGLTLDEGIGKYLATQLNAEKPVFFLRDGMPEQFIFVHDWSARSRALDMLFKLHGSYATSEDVLKDATSVRVIRVDVPRPKPPEVKNLSQGGGAKPNGIKPDAFGKT